MTDQVAARAIDPVLAWFERDARDAMQLAELAAMAARIDRPVLRALRLELLPGVDATAEADLWFSPIVARRTATEIALHPEVLAALRARLARAKVAAAHAVIAAVHAGAPPLLTLEEDLIALGLSNAGEDRIQARLGAVLAALRGHQDRAADIAGWALRALPRLPEPVRHTAAAWSLAFAAEATAGYAIELGAAVPDGAIAIGDDVPSTAIAVSRERDVLCLGATHGPTLQVPATTPRVVVVESGGQRIVATIAPDGMSHVAVGAGDVVLCNLRGERWAARSVPTTRTLSDRDAPENGIWVLIDGTDHYELPPHQLAIAQALGHRLARRGYSLLTIGLAGVSHVVARGFAAALADQGYTSGIYRLAHVMMHAERPDFADWGRIVFRGSSFEPAARTADLVLAIGSSGFSRRIASIGATPIAQLDGDGPDDTGLVAPRPAVWNAVAADDFVTGTLDRIGDRFAVADGDPPAELRRLTHLAATVLDVRDDADHDERMVELRSEAASTVEPDAMQWLVSDARRPAHRLLAYASGHAVPADLMLEALRLEQGQIRQFSETRTLWPAFDCAVIVDVACDDPTARALAARCCSILGDLRTDSGADPGNRQRPRLGALLSHLRYGRRANELVTRAADYDALRVRLSSGDERTTEMTKIVDDVAKRYAQSPAMAEADIWFGHGTPGTAIVGLALLLGAPDPAATPIIEHAIIHQLSPFEQYTAMRVLYQSLDVLSPADLGRLRSAIQDQRGPSGTIDQSDESRWLFSESLLRQIDHRLGETKPSVILFLALDASPSGRLALDAMVRDVERDLRDSPYRDKLSLAIRGVVRPDDLLRVLREERSTIVHFSGHATSRPGIGFRDSGDGELVPSDLLRGLFTPDPAIRMVVLDACFDREQARVLASVVECVIGIPDRIPDLESRRFVTALYRGLMLGASLQNAFDQGLAAVVLRDPDGRNVPALLLRPGVNAAEIYIVPPAPPRGAETA